MKNTISILCIADDNYAPYCGVMLTSLFENNKESSFIVFVFVDHLLKKRTEAKLIKLEEKYSCTIHFIIVDDSFLRQYPLIKDGQWMALSTFYRLYAADLLPASINKILYLDDDIIIAGDLSELWKIDMTDKAVAAVTDAITFYDVRQACLNYPVEAGYFNGGMMLLNLEYWRSNKISQQCFDYIANNHGILKYYDQDILNAVLWNQKINLPLKWNFQVPFLQDILFQSHPDERKNEIMTTLKAPVIIHYSGYMKPWMLLYYKWPLGLIWGKYKKKSPWPYMHPVLPKKKALNWLIKRYIMWPTGLMKYESGFIIEIE